MYWSPSGLGFAYVPALTQDFQYELLKQVHNQRIYFAPIDENPPKRILDIGTGTGIWPIEMAAIFPSAQITGTDLSPIQPNEVPPNVHFFVDDASEEDWMYPSDHFDYIHTRVLLGCLPDFRHLIRNSYQLLKPGGYLECQEYCPKLMCDDDTMPPDFPLKEFHQFQNEACLAMDPPRPLRIADKIARWMREAGFADVQVKMDKVPINPWPRDPRLKNIGRWSETNLLEGIQGFALAFFNRAWGWTREEVEVYLVNVRKSISDRRVHAYHRMFVMYGRKPWPEEVGKAGSAKQKEGKRKEVDADVAVPK